jgi:hypothetical protein
MITIETGVEQWARDEGARAPSADDAAVQAAIARGDAKAVRLNYKPFAKQREFHASPAKYRLFGGAAGPGKSKALLMEAIVQADDHPGAHTLLLRRTFPELEQSLLLYFRRDVPRELYKSFHESKHVVEWRNGSTTRFGYCQSESDVYQYQGAEFLFIGIDELTLFTLRQWQFLTSRNRCPLPGSFPCMAGATNPGNIGHAWVKALWIDKHPAPGMETFGEGDASAYDPRDYDFISARVWDNPIYAADENYLKTLRALPSHLRRAFLDGDWNVFAGQYFDRFDPSRHVTRAETIDWKPWWPRWISIDWGFEHPAATYWHAAAPAMSSPVGAQHAAAVAASIREGFVGAQHAAPAAASSSNDDQEYRVSGESPLLNGAESPRSFDGHSMLCPYEKNAAPVEINGVILSASGEDARRISAQATGSAGSQGHGESTSRVVTYREYVTHRTAPRELAREIIARSVTAVGEREGIDAIYLSPDAFARRTDEASIAEQMGDVFVAAGFPRPIPADNDRVGGWMLMYQMLDAGEWLLTENCIELIRTLPNLVRDPARVEDIEKMEGDDPADAARYGLKSRYSVRRGAHEHLPLEQRLAALVTSPDPTIRAIQARKAQLEQSHRGQPISFLHRRR